MKDLNAWVRWLAAEELIATAPKVPVPRRPQLLFPILADDELARIFACRECSPQAELGIRSHALIAFLLDTGVRVSEVNDLQLAALDLADGSARIHGKGNKERLVYFSPGCAAALKAWLAIRGTRPDRSSGSNGTACG